MNNDEKRKVATLAARVYDATVTHQTASAAFHALEAPVDPDVARDAYVAMQLAKAEFEDARRELDVFFILIRNRYPPSEKVSEKP